MTHEIYTTFPGYVCRNCGEKQNESDKFSSACFYPKTVVLVGEHDKGTGEPFHKATVSGRRLRKIVQQAGLICSFENAFLYPSLARDLSHLHKVHLVIALGRVAERELKRQGVKCRYLPHPACRSNRQRGDLFDGLRDISAQQQKTRRLEAVA